MTDDTKTKESEAVKDSETNDTAEPSEVKSPANQTSATTKEKEKVIEQVQQHETKDPFALIADLTQRLVKLENRPATKVYLKRKENSNDVQEEKPADDETPKKKTAVKSRGKIRLWRTF